jgi:type IV pilus assembly protein PilA
MKKAENGFTLIELMIVVAIIGILAVIAIPNFLRYQLRAKFAEVQENVSAILKSEESLRQSERLVGGVSGLYHSLGLLPASCLPSSTKRAWTTTDLKAAGTIDWVVEGSTYACYTISTGNAPAGVTNAGSSLGVEATTDIDGDGANGCVALFKPFLDSAGAILDGVPDACAVIPTSPPFGQPIVVTPDDVL